MANNYSVRTELFTRNVIGHSFDKRYLGFRWNGKSDEFDFLSSDGTTALEVTAVLAENEVHAMAYQNEFAKGKRPDLTKVKDALADSDGNLLAYDGGSMGEIRRLVFDRINTKNLKAAGRKIIDIRSYELAILVPDGGLFHHASDFSFLIEPFTRKTWVFTRLFIITSTSFFVLDQDGIVEKRRVYQED